MKTTGIFLLIAGILLTIFTSTQFFTKEKVVEIGNLEITKDKPHNYRWNPLFGVVIMAIGGVAIYKSTNK